MVDVKRMAGRHSKRLKHEEPDVVTSEYECFVCHLKSETCERSVQLPCCKQYLHRRCQIQWERYHNTCGLCREPLSGCNDTPPTSSQTNWTSDDDEAAAEAARMEIIQQRSDVDTERIANDVLNMTREEVIRRLRELIDSPALESQLERVREDEFIIRYHFIYSDSDHFTDWKKIFLS